MFKILHIPTARYVEDTIHNVGRSIRTKIAGLEYFTDYNGSISFTSQQDAERYMSIFRYFSDHWCSFHLYGDEKHNRYEFEIVEVPDV